MKKLEHFGGAFPKNLASWASCPIQVNVCLPISAIVLSRLLYLGSGLVNRLGLVALEIIVCNRSSSEPSGEEYGGGATEELWRRAPKSYGGVRQRAMAACAKELWRRAPKS